MKLWVESAYQVWPVGDGATADGVSTLRTEDQFVAAVVGGQEPGVRSQGPGISTDMARRVTAELVSGVPMDGVVADVLAALPAGEHVAAALLRIGCDGRAELVEIDAPPLFMARKGEFILLPVAEEELSGRLVRRCDFTVQAGGHLALVSESYIQARGGARPWSWRDVALSVRRLTATGCDAEQLAGALARLANQQISKSANQQVSEPAFRIPPSAFWLLALFVRPMRTVTVWTGPPADRAADGDALAKLFAERGGRIICGDTTAEIAARLLDARLVLEPRPPDGWKETPPTSRLIGPDGREPVTLVTEGVVTMRVAAERLAAVQRPRDLAGRADGASRLARLLLEADKITFLIGLAVNPSQTERDGTPLRKAAVEGLAEELWARGKIVGVEYQ